MDTIDNFGNHGDRLQEAQKGTNNLDTKDISDSNLHLAFILLKRMGHQLQRFPGVCGYSISGYYKKVEVKMLQQREQPDGVDVAAVKTFITSLMSKQGEEFSRKDISDLVQFVSIKSLPRLSV